MYFSSTLALASHVVLILLSRRWIFGRVKRALGFGQRQVAVQVELAPAVEGMTVDGLKLECKALGLRVNGLRAELETRVQNERARRAS